MKNEWIELSQVMSELAGFPLCSEECSHGGACSLETDHEGDHVAIGSHDRELCRWPREEKL